MSTRVLAAFALICIVAPHARADGPPTILVTVDNFVRAETDRAFAGIVNMDGFGKFEHSRELTAIHRQVVPRQNRDTLYSPAVFDLDAGPVTVTLPDAGQRFMTMIAIDEDHYVHSVVYGLGTYTYSRNQLDTRYALIAIRMLVNPANPKDVAAVHALQDAVIVEQKSPGTFEVPNWDPITQKKVRDALITLGETMPDLRNAFGAKGQVDPIRHLIGTATTWGGNPDKDAIYLNVTPAENDGATVHKVIVEEVPVDGFWSISVYNAEGYFEKNALNAYSLNNITAKKSKDGSVAVQFGGCDGKMPNCLPITKGWNYMVRLYRPREEILNGSWRFPEARPVG